MTCISTMVLWFVIKVLQIQEILTSHLFPLPAQYDVSSAAKSSRKSQKQHLFSEMYLYSRNCPKENCVSLPCRSPCLSDGAGCVMTHMWFLAVSHLTCWVHPTRDSMFVRACVGPVGSVFRTILHPCVLLFHEVIVQTEWTSTIWAITTHCSYFLLHWVSTKVASVQRIPLIWVFSYFSWWTAHAEWRLCTCCVILVRTNMSWQSNTVKLLQSGRGALKPRAGI